MYAKYNMKRATAWVSINLYSSPCRSRTRMSEFHLGFVPFLRIFTLLLLLLDYYSTEPPQTDDDLWCVYEEERRIGKEKEKEGRKGQWHQWDIALRHQRNFFRAWNRAQQHKIIYEKRIKFQFSSDLKYFRVITLRRDEEVLHKMTVCWLLIKLYALV